MFITQYVIFSAVILIVTTGANCSPLQHSAALSDIIDLKSLEKLADKIFDKHKISRVLSLNDSISAETTNNAKSHNRGNAGWADQTEDTKVSRDTEKFNVGAKVDPRGSKDDKDDKGDKDEGHGILPLLIGLKASTFVVGVMSLIGLLTLKAFIASQTAILIAVIIGLKKLFGGHPKTTYKAWHDGLTHVPEYHQISEHRLEPEIFKAHPEIPEQKLLGLYDILKDQKDVTQDNQDAPKYEFQGLEVSPEAPKGQDFHELFGSNLQEFKLDGHQKRRNWKSDGERKPLSLVIGNPHHEPPILTYRKVFTGRNA